MRMTLSSVGHLINAAQLKSGTQLVQIARGIEFSCQVQSAFSRESDSSISAILLYRTLRPSKPEILNPIVHHAP